MTTRYFIITTPTGDMTWLGGPLEKDRSGAVWLTTHDGKRMWRVAPDAVREITRDEAAKLLGCL